MDGTTDAGKIEVVVMSFFRNDSAGEVTRYFSVEEKADADGLIEGTKSTGC